MICNRNAAVSTSKVLLVPYCQHHVPQYHEWMKDPAIQLATASEPLSLDQEFSMQQSWREDADKLTFIVCQPCLSRPISSAIAAKTLDGPDQLIGDVNLFISLNEEKLDEGQVEITGELELMIAKSEQQHKGFGRSALLVFLCYIFENEKAILAEFVKSKPTVDCEIPSFSFLAAKIGQENVRSLALFDSLAFRKVSESASYFGEYELRHAGLTLEGVRAMMAEREIGDYKEVVYQE